MRIKIRLLGTYITARVTALVVAGTPEKRFLHVTTIPCNVHGVRFASKCENQNKSDENVDFTHLPYYYTRDSSLSHTHNLNNCANRVLVSDALS